MKKLLSIVLCAAMLLGVCVTVNAESESDIPKLSKELLSVWIEETIGLQEFKLINDATKGKISLSYIQRLVNSYLEHLNNAIEADIDSEAFKNSLNYIKIDCESIQKTLEDKIDTIVAHKYSVGDYNSPYAEPFSESMDWYLYGNGRNTIPRFYKDMGLHMSIIDNYIDNYMKDSNQSVVSNSDN